MGNKNIIFLFTCFFAPVWVSGQNDFYTIMKNYERTRDFFQFNIDFYNYHANNFRNRPGTSNHAATFGLDILAGLNEGNHYNQFQRSINFGKIFIKPIDATLTPIRIYNYTQKQDKKAGDHVGLAFDIIGIDFIQKPILKPFNNRVGHLSNSIVVEQRQLKTMQRTLERDYLHYYSASKIENRLGRISLKERSIRASTIERNFHQITIWGIKNSGDYVDIGTRAISTIKSDYSYTRISSHVLIQNPTNRNYHSASTPKNWNSYNFHIKTPDVQLRYRDNSNWRLMNPSTHLLSFRPPPPPPPIPSRGGVTMPVEIVKDKKANFSTLLEDEKEEN